MWKQNERKGYTFTRFNLRLHARHVYVLFESKLNITREHTCSTFPRLFFRIRCIILVHCVPTNCYILSSKKSQDNRKISNGNSTVSSRNAALLNYSIYRSNNVGGHNPVIANNILIKMKIKKPKILIFFFFSI